MEAKIAVSFRSTFRVDFGVMLNEIKIANFVSIRSNLLAIHGFYRNRIDVFIERIVVVYHHFFNARKAGEISKKKHRCRFPKIHTQICIIQFDKTDHAHIAVEELIVVVSAVGHVDVDVLFVKLASVVVVFVIAQTARAQFFCL